MTPDDIRSQRFGVRLLRGLSPEEVSAFLEDVAEAYGDVQKWNAVLVARVEKLEHEIQVLEARAKETSASTHIGMQTLIDGAKESEAVILREAEGAKARMRIEAEEHMARATDQAESLIMTAKEQEAALRSELDRLAQSRLQLVDDIRAALDTYQQWLATVDPRGRARGRRETLAMSNGDDESVSASDEVRAG